MQNVSCYATHGAPPTVETRKLPRHLDGANGPDFRLGRAPGSRSRSPLDGVVGASRGPHSFSRSMSSREIPLGRGGAACAANNSGWT